MSVYKDEFVEVCTEMTVSKIKEDSQFVFGWANVSMTPEGIPPLDWQDDIIAPAILEKAAYNFVLNYRVTGEMHVGVSKGVLIESVMFTKEKMASMNIPEGILPEGWWVGFHIPDKTVFAKIKDGQYKMFSIHGKIKRLKV